MLYKKNPGRRNDSDRHPFREHLEVPVLLVAAFSAALSLSCAIRSTLQKEVLPISGSISGTLAGAPFSKSSESEMCRARI